jgi:RNA polymerase sigma-70 factor (ECF subfamily)
MFTGRVLARLHSSARAERWRVDLDVFGRALEASAAKAFGGSTPDAKELERYASALHLEDRALACACAEGDEDAWQHFVLTYRPSLYRAADAIDPTGGARDLADSIYADLYGLAGRTGERQSLFRYFHGRSSLATWLRAVMSQRFVDRVREKRRVEPLPSDEGAHAIAAPFIAPDPDRRTFGVLARAALAAALALLTPKDRLRLACYYARQMTLAEVGRLLGEHEATVSRQLAKTRSAIRAQVERCLRLDHRLDPDAIDQCFSSMAEDAGPLDLDELLPVDAALAPGDGRKKQPHDRSNEGQQP